MRLLNTRTCIARLHQNFTSAKCSLYSPILVTPLHRSNPVVPITIFDRRLRRTIKLSGRRTHGTEAMILAHLRARMAHSPDGVHRHHCQFHARPAQHLGSQATASLIAKPVVERCWYCRRPRTETLQKGYGPTRHRPSCGELPGLGTTHRIQFRNHGGALDPSCDPLRYKTPAHYKSARNTSPTLHRHRCECL